MFALLKFICAAFDAGVVYVDCDGTLLKKFPVPEHIHKHNAALALLWWSFNLEATPVIKRRLPLLYFLRLFGVRLVLWTNRGPQHRSITLKALGVHLFLFGATRFRNGCKVLDRLDGPVIEDDERYLVCTRLPSLLVKPL